MRNKGIFVGNYDDDKVILIVDNKHFSSFEEIILKQNLAGLGHMSYWIVDLMNIIYLVCSDLTKEELKQDEELIELLIEWTDYVILEEIIHSIGESHYNNSHDWTPFFVEYSYSNFNAL